MNARANKTRTKVLNSHTGYADEFFYMIHNTSKRFLKRVTSRKNRMFLKQELSKELSA